LVTVAFAAATADGLSGLIVRNDTSFFFGNTNRLSESLAGTTITAALKKAHSFIVQKDSSFHGGVSVCVG
jgi:hypothetical protein